MIGDVAVAVGVLGAAGFAFGFGLLLGADVALRCFTGKSLKGWFDW